MSVSNDSKIWILITSIVVLLCAAGIIFVISNRNNVEFASEEISDEASQKLLNLSESDEISALELELSQTDFTGLSAELDDIDRQLDY